MSLIFLTLTVKQQPFGTSINNAEKTLKNKNLNAKKLILDFSGVSFMDSTGIGMLLGRYNKFAKNDINIYIKNPTSYINRIFAMTGIYQIIPKVC